MKIPLSIFTFLVRKFYVSLDIDLLAPKENGQFVPFGSIWHDPAVLAVGSFTQLDIIYFYAFPLLTIFLGVLQKNDMGIQQAF